MTDRDIVRRLAERVREIAGRPEQAEKTRLWKTCNDLEPERPMVYADPQGGWEDLDAQWIRLECADKRYRGIEHALRRLILRDEHIPDDFPIVAEYRIGPAVTGDTYDDYGMPLLTTKPEEAGGAYHIEPLIQSRADMAKLHFRPVAIDAAETERRFQFASDAFGDILPVVKVGRGHWRYGLTRVLIHMRGFEQMLLDYYENPELIHELMAFLRDDFLAEIEIYERAGMVGLSNHPQSVLGSGGLAYCSTLPEELPTGTVPGTMDGFAWGESQETVGVGPRQFEEFVLRYQLPLLSKFRLVDYGCCEGLEGKVDLLIDNLPNLRWLAVSPWANREKMAERIGGNYVYVYKPNPSRICMREPDWAAAEKELRETLAIAKGCPVHLVMKDTKTFQHDGERITRWCRTAVKVAEDGPR